MFDTGRHNQNYMCIDAFNISHGLKTPTVIAWSVCLCHVITSHYKQYEPVHSIFFETHVRPVETQLSDQSLLSARRPFGSLATHIVSCKDFDYTEWISRLFWSLGVHAVL